MTDNLIDPLLQPLPPILTLLPLPGSVSREMQAGRNAAAVALVKGLKGLSAEDAAEAINDKAGKMAENAKDDVYAELVTTWPVPDVVAVTAASHAHPDSARKIVDAALRWGSPMLSDSLLSLFTDMLWRPHSHGMRIGKQVWETQAEIERRLDPASDPANIRHRHIDATVERANERAAQMRRA